MIPTFDDPEEKKAFEFEIIGENGENAGYNNMLPPPPKTCYPMTGKVRILNNIKSVVCKCFHFGNG